VRWPCEHITDKGLEHLKAVQTLTELRLIDTKVTAAGVAALQAALPKCKITVSPAVQAELDKLTKPSPATATTDPDRQAAEWVLGRGGTVVLYLGGERRVAKSLAELPAAAFAVTECDLSGKTSVSNEVFEHLKGLRHLGNLWLNGTGVTGQGLEQLQSTKLGGLSLNGTRVNDATLQHVKGLTALQLLSLEGTAVSGPGLQHLHGMKSLSFLEIGATPLTDVGLEHLREMKSLGHLGIYWTKVTDGGMEHLKGLSNLALLNLNGTHVTDKGLEPLKALQKLTELHLEENKNVTAGGVAALQAALPKCKITVSPEVQKALDEMRKK
jgi:hypothetical protein